MKLLNFFKNILGMRREEAKREIEKEPVSVKEKQVIVSKSILTPRQRRMRRRRDIGFESRRINWRMA